MTLAVRKEHPLSLRLAETDLAVIDRAAALRGRSRTEFMCDGAVRAAEEVLLDTLPIRMSPEGFDAFLATLSESGAAVPEMTQALQHPAPWERTPE